MKQPNAIESQKTLIPLSSVNRYSQAVFDAGATTAAANDPSNIALLQPFDNFEPVKPERVRSFEVGYKSLIDNKLLIDFAVYYNIYLDFITQVQLEKSHLIRMEQKTMLL